MYVRWKWAQNCYCREGLNKGNSEVHLDNKDLICPMTMTTLSVLKQCELYSLSIMPCRAAAKRCERSFHSYSVHIIPSQDVWDIKRTNCWIALVCYIHVWQPVVEFSSLYCRGIGVYDNHFLLIVFSKHIFHLLLIVPCPQLSSSPPCSFPSHFKSVRLKDRLSITII